MNEYDGWDLWRRWVLAHVKGLVLGIALGCVVGALAGIVSLFVCAYCAILIGPGVGWLAFIGILGVAQENALWPGQPLNWTRHTVVGGLLAVGAALFAGGGAVVSPLNWIGAGVAGGAVLGLVQWASLRSAYDPAWIWVPANMLAWPLGGAAAYVVNAFLTDVTQLGTLQTPIAFLAPILNPLASAGAAVLIVAMITGGALLLMRDTDALWKPAARQG